MIPNSARVWNYWAGGKDNYEADGWVGEAFRAVAPQIATMARDSRLYLSRAVTVLAAEGITQFLDIGTGLPAADNTHEVAQRVNPAALVVYVDNDPNVVNHARALSVSTRAGRVVAVNADLNNPDAIVAAAGDHLDFSRPVALMLMGVLGHIEEHADATAIVRRLLAGLSPGSCLVHYDCTDDNADLVKAQDNYNQITGALPYILRSPEEITSYYEGLELLAPGIVSCPLWRPGPDPDPDPRFPQYTGGTQGGVARKA